MTVSEIKSRIRATIDQFYHFPNVDYVKKNQLQYVGGILQTALHLLDFDSYNEIKQYIYTQYGYDCGGCTDGQMSLNDLKEVGNDRE